MMTNPEIEQLTRCIEQLTNRIEQLTNCIEESTRRTETLETIAKNHGLMSEFQPLKVAAVALKLSEGKLRKDINTARLNPRKHRAKAGIHYNFKGNRIFINVAAWERDINSISPENR